MASIRRAQSPFHLSNGGGASHHQKPFLKPLLSRKPSLSCSLSLYTYLVFFSLGFLLGLSPSFRHLDNNDPNSAFPTAIADVATHGIDIRPVELGIQETRNCNQVIVVTPTYNRAMQAYFLNRLGQVLRKVRGPVMWVVVESDVATDETAEILRKMGVMYRHLVCKENNSSTNDVKDRGVHQRNTALEHIERHRIDGIVYFADDDNVYSIELFEKLREIRRFGTWPVAMLAHSKNKAILEGPVCNGSKVIGWHTNEKSKRLRRFHVDMSGFAFNSTILWDPKRWRRPTSNPIRQLDTVKEGFQETTFIEQVVEDEYQMEGIAPNCSRIMNWHLHLEGSKFFHPRGWFLLKNLDVVLPIV